MGVPQDDERAAHWWRLAAAQDYTEAQYSLGMMYLQRPQTPENKSSAASWLARAVHHGHEDAEINLQRLLPDMPRARIRVEIDVRESADPSAVVIATATVGGYVYELARRGDWVQVYLRRR